jgi:hypothetical protein
LDRCGTALTTAGRRKENDPRARSPRIDHLVVQ